MHIFKDIEEGESGNMSGFSKKSSQSKSNDIRSWDNMDLTISVNADNLDKSSIGTVKGCMSLVFAILVPIFLPLCHITIFNQLWGNMNNPVDPLSCSCSCWDTVFKGPYESGIAGYKHVYFNGTWNTFKMWTITVVGVVFFYECFKKLFVLMFLRKLRYSMAILFLSSLHSHYYAWWAHWNYWNDDFYELWYHQIFFTVSELVSSILVISYVDKRKPTHPLPILVIANISMFHILSSGWDQFFYTVIQQKGHLHQVLRDIVLMSTDFIHAGISLYELRIYAKKKGQTLYMTISQKNHIAAIVFTTFTMYMSVLLYP